MVLALLLRLLNPQKTPAENRFEFKHEIYAEDHGRISVETTSGSAELGLAPALTAHANVVLDSISGATPTGGPPPFGTTSTEVPLASLSDRRRAVSVDVSQRIGLWTLTPQLAHSQESDYESWGAALNQSFDFNQKNTTLTIGVSHDFDTVMPGHSRLTETRHKDTTDVLIGVTQLLGPKTILTANLTGGYTTGYLADPYKGFNFNGAADPDALFDEVRPSHKGRVVGLVSLTQYITPANASVELSYRIHTDTYGIWSHTVAASWFQKIGKRVIVEPFVRYYRQSAADFYYVTLPGDPSLDPTVAPAYYSADYRLSDLTSWTYGIKLTIRILENLAVDLGYKRYEMSGEDGVTMASAYPKAHVFSAGASLTF